jgi:predicted NUDIX family phosphoesterase
MDRFKDEKVMVVHRDHIFYPKEWTGINPKFFKLLETVRKTHTFLPRNEVENNPAWQQIIPFAVLVCHGKIFCYIKSHEAGEQRLVNERMIGIGGHLRPQDTIDYGSLLGWFEREWREEVQYKGLPFAVPIGVIHDPTRDVSAVHLGFTFILYGNEFSIRIRDGEELKEGRWLSLEDFKEIDILDKARGLGGIDNWSTAIINYLRKNRGILTL